jgi:2-oxoisovalerate dehydrogenase E1 component alpha subunit
MTSIALSSEFLRDIYAKMLLTRIVDECAQGLYAEGYIDFLSSCLGHEATQIGSAICIEVGQDFTLPYYRDLGVVLTLGMTPYEVFRTYLQSHHKPQTERLIASQQIFQHWGYQKHNTITGSAPVGTQLLHAAGIAFASKLRNAAVVTIAYCGNDVTKDPDFVESIQFATLHQLPIVFICEQDNVESYASDASTSYFLSSCLEESARPSGLSYQLIDSRNVVAIYSAMRQAMQHAREGHGPTFLEMAVVRSYPHIAVSHAAIVTSTGVTQHVPLQSSVSSAGEIADPLVCCQHVLQERGIWDDEWASQLSTRIMTEVKRALQDALRDTLQSK